MWYRAGETVITGERLMHYRWGGSLPRPFTLTELLVVMAIISVLASLLVPALRNALDEAKSIQCTSNARQIYMAFGFYSDQQSGRLPADSAMYPNGFYAGWPAVPWYHHFSTEFFDVSEIDLTDSKGIFVCPSDEEPYAVQGVADSYGLNSYASQFTPNLFRFKNPGATYLMGDADTYRLALWNASTAPEYRHRDGLNMLFADGHVDREWNPLPPSGGFVLPWCGYTP